MISVLLELQRLPCGIIIHCQCAAAARAGRKEEVASTDICVDVAKAAVIALTSLRRKKH